MTCMNTVRLVSVVAATVCLYGCASGRLTLANKSTGADKASVCKVDFSEAPGMKELAERARQLGNEVYPKILTLLADDTSKLPQHFDIVFKKHTWRGNPGVTLGTRIRLNAEWLTKNPASLEMVLVHEMAHVAQHYKWYRRYKIPPHWHEGIADYTRYKLGYTNGWRCPQCAVEFPHYTSGYACAGAFLLFVDATCGSNVVRQLNAELRRGSYSDKFFTKTTGKSLDKLWAEFQQTPAFTPVAAEVNKLHNALGYVNGKPPRWVRDRFEAYLKRQGETQELLRDAADEMKGKPLMDVFRLYALFRYFEEAGQFLESLRDKGQLPGFSKDEPGEISFEASELECGSEAYRGSRAFSCTKDGDPSTYHYIVIPQSKDGVWRLVRAWRTGPDGRVIEEYPVPCKRLPARMSDGRGRANDSAEIRSTVGYDCRVRKD